MCMTTSTVVSTTATENLGSGRVELTAETVGNRVRITVTDNGIGVAPRYHERIFRGFERLHGRVGVDSDGTDGSRFRIEPPVAEPPARR